MPVGGLLTWQWKLAGWKERETIDACPVKVVEPITGHGMCGPRCGIHQPLIHRFARPTLLVEPNARPLYLNAVSPLPSSLFIHPYSAVAMGETPTCSSIPTPHPFRVHTTIVRPQRRPKESTCTNSRVMKTRDVRRRCVCMGLPRRGTSSKIGSAVAATWLPWRGFKSLGHCRGYMTRAHAAKANSDKMSPRISTTAQMFSEGNLACRPVRQKIPQAGAHGHFRQRCGPFL